MLRLNLLFHTGDSSMALIFLCGMFARMNGPWNIESGMTSYMTCGFGFSVYVAINIPYWK